MEGQLAKKTTGGKWKPRHFKLEGTVLTWLKSDNKTALSVELNAKDVLIRDVKFGVRKFVFEVVTEGRSLQLAASGEAEKQQWIEALERASGKKKPPQTQQQQPKKIDATKVAGLASVLGLVDGTSPDTGGNREATERLRQKLAGTSVPLFSSPTSSPDRKGAESPSSQDDERDAMSGDEEHRALVNSGGSNNNNAPQAAFATQTPAKGRNSTSPRKKENATVDSSTPSGAETQAGKIDHSAALSKPTIRGRRQAPQRVSVGKMLGPVEIKDKMTHENSFRIETGTGLSLVMHASSLAEKDKWVHCVANAIQLVKLKSELESAQRTDMRAAIQAQLNLEAYEGTYQTAYSGYLEKLSLKSQRNWKKRYFELKAGKFLYYVDENSKKEKFSTELTRFSVVKDNEGKKVEAQGAQEIIPAKEPDIEEIGNAGSFGDRRNTNSSRKSKKSESPVKPTASGSSPSSGSSQRASTRPQQEKSPTAAETTTTTGRPKSGNFIVELEKKKSEALAVEKSRAILEGRKSDLSPGFGEARKSGDFKSLGEGRKSGDFKTLERTKSTESNSSRRRSSDLFIERKKTEERLPAAVTEALKKEKLSETRLTSSDSDAGLNSDSPRLSVNVNVQTVEQPKPGNDFATPTSDFIPTSMGSVFSPSEMSDESASVILDNQPLLAKKSKRAASQTRTAEQIEARKKSLEASSSQAQSASSPVASSGEASPKKKKTRFGTFFGGRCVIS